MTVWVVRGVWSHEGSKILCIKRTKTAAAEYVKTTPEGAQYDFLTIEEHTVED